MQIDEPYPMLNPLQRLLHALPHGKSCNLNTTPTFSMRISFQSPKPQVPPINPLLLFLHNIPHLILIRLDLPLEPQQIPHSPLQRPYRARFSLTRSHREQDRFFPVAAVGISHEGEGGLQFSDGSLGGSRGVLEGRADVADEAGVGGGVLHVEVFCEDWEGSLMA